MERKYCIGLDCNSPFRTITCLDDDDDDNNNNNNNNYYYYYYYVHCCGASGSMRACHAAGPGSIPGRDKFPG